MATSYKKLFYILIEKDLTQVQLQHDVGSYSANITN